MLPPAQVPSVRLALHPRLGEDRCVALASAIERAGLEVSVDGHGAGILLPLEAVPECNRGVPRVALFDGQLRTELGGLLQQTPSVLLLACREDGLPSLWELRTLAVTLGASPLFTAAPGPTMAWRVGRVDELHAIAREAADAVRAAGGKAAAAGMAADVMHELAANALLDAPVGIDGVPKYAHRRTEELEIAPSDACRATVAIAEGRVYLSATDLFGRLTAAPVASAISGLGRKAQLNQAGGGAGLGLRRVLEQCDLFAARVRPGVVSEVVCTLDLGDNRRRRSGAKSLFFSVAGGREEAMP